MRIVLLSAMLAMPLMSGSASAQEEWAPNRAIRLIVPYAPGGTSDILGRILAEYLKDRLGQTVIVENRSGGGGVVGTDVAVRAAADGYTLALISSPSASVPYLVKRVPHDLLKDADFIGLVARAQIVLLGRKSLNVKSLPDFINYAKTNNTEFGSPGLGSGSHLAGELLKLGTKIEIRHVPYRGGGPAIADLLGGHVDFILNALPATLPYIQDGSLRPIAVTGAARSPAAPDIPTMIEFGLAGFVIYEWWGVIGPRGLPPEITQRIGKEIQSFLARPETRAKFASLSVEAAYMNPLEFRSFMQSEMERSKVAIEGAGIKPE